MRQFIWSTGLNTCGAFAPDSTFAVTGTQDHKVLIWKMPSAEEINEPVKGTVSWVDESLSSGSTRQVRIWVDVNNTDPQQAAAPDSRQHRHAGGAAGEPIKQTRRQGDKETRRNALLLRLLVSLSPCLLVSLSLVDLTWNRSWRRQLPLPRMNSNDASSSRFACAPTSASRPQKYEGRTYYVVKDPVSLRYYRLKEHEHFLVKFMDGKTHARRRPEGLRERYRPDRLKLEDLEGFAQQLLTAGLAQNESPKAGKQLFDRRKKRLRSEWMQTLTNILYIKIPVFDPGPAADADAAVSRAGSSRCRSSCSASRSCWRPSALVATHFDDFRSKLPDYHEFFSFKPSSTCGSRSAA